MTLDKELIVGTYDAIVTYHLLDDNERECETFSVNKDKTGLL